MRKILIGLVCLIVLGAAGYFGAQAWAQRRAETEINTTLDAIRAAGGVATVGAIRFDLWSRTLAVTDLLVAGAGEPSTALRVGHIDAIGVGMPASGRISASQITMADTEIDVVLPAPLAARYAYKAPRVEIEDFSGPAGPLRQLDMNSALDVARLVLDHFVATSIHSLTIPTITGTGTVTGPQPNRPPGTLTFTYSGMRLHDIRDGRIASNTVDQVTFSVSNPAADDLGNIKGDIANIASTEFDATPLRAALDPAGATDDSYHRVYRRISAGPYRVEFGKAGHLQIEAVSINDVGLNPAKLRLNEAIVLFAAMRLGQTPPVPEQMRAVLETSANIYDGMRLGRAELNGWSFTAPPGATGTIGNIHIDGLERGRIGEFALEGVNVNVPKQPAVKVGRFALKGLGIGPMMRRAASRANGNPTPTPDELGALFGLLESIEIKGLSAAAPGSSKPVDIETASVAWSRVVGALPTQAHVELNVTAPAELGNQDPDVAKFLADAGFDSISTKIDLGADWTPDNKTLSLAPATIEIAKAFSIAVKASLGNVAAELFSGDQLKTLMSLPQVEMRPMEIVLHDLGGLNLAIDEFARAEGSDAKTVRQMIIDNLNAFASDPEQSGGDLGPAATALASFVQSPGGSFTLRIAPRAPLALLELVQAAQVDPMAAVARLKIEATASR